MHVVSDVWVIVCKDVMHHMWIPPSLIVVSCHWCDISDIGHIMTANGKDLCLNSMCDH